MDENTLKPPSPPGLDNLSPPLKDFVAFFDLDQDLIDAAAKTCTESKSPDLTRDGLATWLKALPESEKNAILLRLVDGEGPRLALDLEARFRRDREKAARSAVKKSKAGG